LNAEEYSPRLESLREREGSEDREVGRERRGRERRERKEKGKRESPCLVSAFLCCYCTQGIVVLWRGTLKSTDHTNDKLVLTKVQEQIQWRK
jgi:hypothetical protein